MTKLTIEELATFCKKKGFVFQAAEIYGGLAGFFDFGPLGVELKNNVKQLYWNKFVKRREDIFGQDGSIITNPKVWKASGHVDTFADLILTTKETKTKLRADHFIEDELNIPGDGLSAKDINELVKKHKLKYNDEEFEEVNDFNLMFSTQVGPSAEKNATSYLRPETCQSIFPNFKAIAEVSRAKLPFGIVQIGKAFRNEISPRDFLFRSREFEQMEMEYFFDPKADFELPKDLAKVKFQFLSAEDQEAGKDKMVDTTIADLVKKKKILKIHAYWLAEFINWFQESGLSMENMRVREHMKKELSHYSSATMDVDYKYPHGFKEMFGLANRTDYDLKQHQEHSNKSLEIFDEASGKKLIPNVIEPSLGVERFMLALMCEAYNDDKDRGNVVLNFNPKLSPYKVAILPLVNKGGLPEVAREIQDKLQEGDISVFYDRSGSVGRRYARQDEIGTPYCITVDFETIEDGNDKDTVTIRDRDSTEQKRVKIEDLPTTMYQLLWRLTTFSKLK